MSREVLCPDCNTGNTVRLFDIDKPQDPVYGKSYRVHSLWQCLTCKRCFTK